MATPPPAGIRQVGAGRIPGHILPESLTIEACRHSAICDNVATRAMQGVEKSLVRSRASAPFSLARGDGRRPHLRRGFIYSCQYERQAQKGICDGTIRIGRL
jgi:hypothetical protein